MKSKQINCAYILATLLIFANIIFAGVVAAPAKITAVLILKTVHFEKRLGGSAKDLTVYVMGAPDVLAELKKMEGKKIGKATLKVVSGGDAVPAAKPDAIFIGKSSLQAGIAYSQSNKILSISNVPDLVTGGVTLGYGIENKKPKILLNLSSSSLEGCDWNPAIMKVAKTIK